MLYGKLTMLHCAQQSDGKTLLIQAIHNLLSCVWNGTIGFSAQGFTG